MQNPRKGADLDEKEFRRQHQQELQERSLDHQPASQIQLPGFEAHFQLQLNKQSLQHQKTLSEEK